MLDRNRVRTRHSHHHPDLRVPLGYLAVIVGAGTLALSNSLDNPFIWDDQTAIVDNPTIRSLWPPWGPLVPPLETPVSRRPLVNLTFAISYALHGLDVTGYHLFNLGAHVLAACLLFGIVRRTLAGERLRDRFGGRASIVALIATLLWMVHPLVSEVINYATQRTTVMAGVFFFATLYAAQRALGSPHQGRWHAAAVTACALGMLSKESVAVAPLAVVLYDRSFAFPTLRQAIAVRARFYGALAAAWVPLGALLVLRPHTTVGFSTAVTPWTYLLNQAQMVPHYLRLAVWPDALVLDYGFPRVLSFTDVAAGALVVAVLLVCTLVALVRWPAVGFLGAAFFLGLAPSSSIVPVATEVGAERRMYLPLAAIAVLATVGGTWLLDWVQSRAPSRFRRHAFVIGLLLAAAGVTGLMTRTLYRNAEFSTERSIWRTSVERWPHGRARASYAAALIDIGEEDRAIRQLELAVRDFPIARVALGTELAARHRYDEALRELSNYVQSATRSSDQIPARTLRGEILAHQGHLDEAIEEFRSLVALFPSRRRARSALADLLYQRRDYEEAASHYRLLLAQQPDDAGWLVKLGMALAATGQFAEALASYQRALKIDPAVAFAHARLAELLLRVGKPSEAADHAQAALALEPRDAIAHNLLGVAMAMDGRFAEAIAHFDASVNVDPANAEARNNLARARRELQKRNATLPGAGAETAQ